jgi:uncharacterized protein YkwD
LESRSLLSSGGPTAQEQYMLELVNMARTNPAEMASWLRSNLDANDLATIQHFGVNIDAELSAVANSSPVQPLAWNSTLASTAQEQSQYEADNQIQTHQGPGEMSLEQRLDAAGYTNRVADGENSYAYAQSVEHAMKAFLIDWGVPDHGHRGNLLQPNTSDNRTYSDVGIGIVATNPGSQVGPFVMTQDFGRQANSLAQVVGVVYTDSNGNGMYDVGEGSGNASIVVTGQDGKVVAQTTTWDSGGYEISLAPGSYQVTAVVNGQVVRTQNVTIGSDNVEINFNLSQHWQGGSLAALTAPPTPVTPPTPPPPPPPPTPVTRPTPPTPVTPSIVFQNPVQAQVNNDAPQVVPDNQGLGVSWLSSWTWWRKS